MMTGFVRHIPVKEGRQTPFTFIKGEDGIDYFLHKTDLTDSWDDLKWYLEKLNEVPIEFEWTQSEKGRRAVGAQIIRADGNNTIE